MKYISFLLLMLLLVGCTPSKNGVELTLQDFVNDISIPEQIDSDIDLPSTYTIDGSTVTAEWTSSDSSIISNDGKITRGIDNQNVTLTLLLTGLDDSLYEIYDIVVLGIGKKTFINNAIDTLTIPTESKVNLNLVNRIYFERKNINVTWVSSNQDILTNDGKVGLITEDKETKLTLIATFDNQEVRREYSIKIIALNNDEQNEYIFKSIDIMPTISQSLSLPTEFPFGKTGTWVSDKPTILTNDGQILLDGGRQTVRLTLTLNTKETRTFEMDVITNNHLIIDREFNGTKNNLEMNNGKLVLTENAIEGTYVSNDYETFNFTQLVASWSALSSTTATVEVEISVRVNNTWSQYISYGKWGYGLQNASPGKTLDLIKKVDDEIFVLNNKAADALRFKATLRRNDLSNDSPALSLIAVALLINDYSFTVEKSSATSKDYEVPKLNQNIVPGIGDSICSPTSSTMLLQYMGIDFSQLTQDEFPHRYFAEIAFEHATKIYGNWVYNTVAMSAFGFDSYVKRMYSVDELLDHLDRVGPVAASVKGSMIGEIGGTWTTNGHLIVVRGYRYDGDQLFILANDPNKSNVYEEYKVHNFLNVWRNVIYVIE